MKHIFKVLNYPLQSNSTTIMKTTSSLVAKKPPNTGMKGFWAQTAQISLSMSWTLSKQALVPNRRQAHSRASFMKASWHSLQDLSVHFCLVEVVQNCFYDLFLIAEWVEKGRQVWWDTWPGKAVCSSVWFHVGKGCPGWVYDFWGLVWWKIGEAGHLLKPI